MLNLSRVYLEHAAVALLEEACARGLALDTLAEAAKLRLLGSPQLYEYDAHYRLACSEAVEYLAGKASGCHPEPSHDHPEHRPHD